MEEGRRPLGRDRKWARKKGWELSQDLLSARAAAGIPPLLLTPEEPVGRRWDSRGGEERGERGNDKRGMKKEREIATQRWNGPRRPRPE